ncbi:MAG: hypothetical protein GYA33_02455 [Thermogutta sp.]|nr:hypothetical protein [Thermogutta sp.]
MPFPMRCSACGRQLTIPDDLMGKKVRCPCGQVIEVPKEPPLHEEDLYAVAEPAAERREDEHRTSSPAPDVPDRGSPPVAASPAGTESTPDLRDAPQLRWAAGLAIGYGCIMTLVAWFFPHFTGFCCSYYPGLVCFPALAVSGILLLQGNPLGVECVGIFAAASAFLTFVSAVTILFVSVVALIKGQIGGSLLVGGVAAAAVAVPAWLFLWALRLHRKWRALQDAESA